MFEGSIAGSFCDGLGAVCVGDRWGYINKRGEMVVEPSFDFAYNFSEGLGQVAIDKRKGYINQAGEMVIEPRFEYASEFSDGSHK